jgi:hypothetical protein
MHFACIVYHTFHMNLRITSIFFPSINNSHQLVFVVEAL